MSAGRDLLRATLRVPLELPQSGRLPDSTRGDQASGGEAFGPNRDGVLQPGGPAAAKALFTTVVEGLLAPVRERFDVITWDLRGLGESTAVKRCASRADEDRFFAGVGKPSAASARAA